jgi:hypothetical protein
MTCILFILKKYILLQMHKKLTDEAVREIYHQAWDGTETCEKVGKRYGVTKANVIAIKHGYIWHYVTGHQQYVSSFVRNMSTDQKIEWFNRHPDSAIVVIDRYWELFEEYGQDIADRFKTRTHDKGYLLRRKLTIPEVEEIHEEIKNENTEDNNDRKM